MLGQSCSKTWMLPMKTKIFYLMKVCAGDSELFRFTIEMDNITIHREGSNRIISDINRINNDIINQLNSLMFCPRINQKQRLFRLLNSNKSIQDSRRLLTEKVLLTKVKKDNKDCHISLVWTTWYKYFLQHISWTYTEGSHDDDKRICCYRWHRVSQ